VLFPLSHHVLDEIRPYPSNRSEHRQEVTITEYALVDIVDVHGASVASSLNEQLALDSLLDRLRVLRFLGGGVAIGRSLGSVAVRALRLGLGLGDPSQPAQERSRDWDRRALLWSRLQLVELCLLGLGELLIGV
jgi:hypothetical protein